MNVSLKKEIISLRKEIRHFAFLELALAVTVLGVVISAAVPRYSGHIKKARTQEAVSRLSSIMMDSKIYYYKAGRWPQSQGEEGYYANFSPTEHFTYRIITDQSITDRSIADEKVDEGFALQAAGCNVDDMKDVTVIMSCADISSENIIEVWHSLKPSSKTSNL